MTLCRASVSRASAAKVASGRSIGDYDIGGDEMNFYCTAFKTDHVSFEIPEG